MMLPENFCIVLVEPQGGLNIGSVCRSMMNFGFVDLRLVNPQVDHLSKDATDMAVNARPLLEKATIFNNLASALADCHIAFGTTRRFGKYREECIVPEMVCSHTKQLHADAKIALVFGREDNGLHTSELDLCQLFITIPTHQNLPSMNLAQAVTLCLYEISKNLIASTRLPTDATERCQGKTLEIMFQHMRKTLLEIGFLDPQNPDHILRSFRRIFGRSGLTDREVKILQGLWSKLDWLNKERCKGQDSAEND